MTALGGVSDGSRPKGASCTNIPLNDTNSTRKATNKFIVLMGVVSLTADMTHEGARSITGPYLAFLGASATVVRFLAGFGELVGYAFRFVSGYFGDRTGMYWGDHHPWLCDQHRGRAPARAGRPLGNSRRSHHRGNVWGGPSEIRSVMPCSPTRPVRWEGAWDSVSMRPWTRSER